MITPNQAVDRELPFDLLFTLSPFHPWLLTCRSWRLILLSVDVVEVQFHEYVSVKGKY